LTGGVNDIDPFEFGSPPAEEIMEAGAAQAFIIRIPATEATIIRYNAVIFLLQCDVSKASGTFSYIAPF
jgi:hypothetical protein